MSPPENGGADPDRLYERIAADGRRVDVLFANAGVVEVVPLAEVTGKHLDFILGVNVKGAVSPCRRRCH